MVTWPMMSRDPERSNSWPLIRLERNLENSWRCYLATIAITIVCCEAVRLGTIKGTMWDNSWGILIGTTWVIYPTGIPLCPHWQKPAGSRWESLMDPTCHLRWVPSGCYRLNGVSLGRSAILATAWLFVSEGFSVSQYYQLQSSDSHSH